MATKTAVSNDEEGQNKNGAMSWISGMCVIAGCMIGAGVFVTGGDVYKKAPNPYLAIGLWIIGGLTAVCGGLAWAEWALMIPKSGGDIPYLEHAYPKMRRFFSFQFVWCRSVFSNPICLALLSGICANFLLKLFVPLDFGLAMDYNIFDTGKKENVNENIDKTLLYVAYLGVSYLIMLLAFCLLAFSDEIIVKSGTVLTIFKILIVSFLIFCGFRTLLPGYRAGVTTTWEAAGISKVTHVASSDIVDGVKSDDNVESSKVLDVGKIAGALLVVFFSYDGFANLSAVIGDLKNPRRDTLRAILSGVIIVSCLYTCINIFYYFGLTEDEIMNSGFGLAAQYFSLIFLGNPDGTNDYILKENIIKSTISFCIFISAFGALLGISFAASRITYVSGTLGKYLPFSAFFGTKSKRFGTPFNSIVLQFVLAIPIVAASCYSSVQTALFSAAMYCNWIFYTITAGSLIYVRFRDPNMERPFRAPIICPVIVVIVGVFMLIMPWAQTGEDKYQKLLAPIIGVASFTLGTVAYYFTIYRKEKKSPS